MKSKELANYPWVFWLSISCRPKWFSYNWSTRGANYKEIQWWIFKINIGRPWLKIVVDAHARDFGSAKYIHDTNKTNSTRLFSFNCPPPIKNNSH